jgi:ribosome-binding factor A
MARYQRTDRINEQLRQEIALMLASEVRDPRVGMVTVTAVKASPELDHARIFVTMSGDEAERQEGVAGLQSAAPFIRGQLGRRLHMRRIPELHFELDRTLEGAARIESLLRQVQPLPSEDAGDDDSEDETTPDA